MRGPEIKGSPFAQNRIEAIKMLDIECQKALEVLRVGPREKNLMEEAFKHVQEVLKVDQVT